MLARQVVLLTSSESFHPSQLPSRQQSTAVNPLAATLMDLPASVANKRLTAELSPLAATLTKNKGVEAPPFDVSTFRRSDVPTFQRTLQTLFSLFAQRAFDNLSAIKIMRTLSENC